MKLPPFVYALLLAITAMLVLHWGHLTASVRGLGTVQQLTSQP